MTQTIAPLVRNPKKAESHEGFDSDPIDGRCDPRILAIDLEDSAMNFIEVVWQSFRGYGFITQEDIEFHFSTPCWTGKWAAIWRCPNVMYMNGHPIPEYTCAKERGHKDLCSPRFPSAESVGGYYEIHSR